MPKQTSNRKSNKTVVRSTKRSFKKWQLGLIAVAGIALIGAAGTYMYTQKQQKDLQAKAAAFVLRKEDYITPPGPGTKIAICQNSNSVYAIVSTTWQVRETKGLVITLGSSPGVGRVTGALRWNSAKTFTIIGNSKVATASVAKYAHSPWAQVKHSDGVFDITQTKVIHINFIPYC